MRMARALTAQGGLHGIGPRHAQLPTKGNRMKDRLLVRFDDTPVRTSCESRKNTDTHPPTSEHSLAFIHETLPLYYVRPKC